MAADVNNDVAVQMMMWQMTGVTMFQHFQG